MEIGGRTFQFICDIEPLRDPGGAIQQYLPQSRYAKASTEQINRYGAGPFCKFKIPHNLRVSGVYALTVGDAVRYIGECADFSARFNNGYGNISPRNCYKGGQETNCRLNNLVFIAATSGEAIRLWFLSTDDYKAVEARLREVLRPMWNRV